MDYKLLGQNIRKYRKNAGMSQKDLAEYIDKTEGHISKIERGEGIPSLEVVVNIAKALSVSTDVLLAENYSYPERTYLHEIYEIIKYFPEDKKEKARKALKMFMTTLEIFE